MIEMIETNTRKDKRPGTNILLTHLNRLDDTLTQIRDDPKEQSILDAIQNLSDHTKRSFSTLNEKLIISTHQIQSSHITTASPQAGALSYRNALISKATPHLSIPSSTIPTTKSCKVIIKLNAPQVIDSIKKKPVEDITDAINRHMEE